MPIIKTTESLLFHHHQFPSITVPAHQKADVPEWVLRTGTFGAHAKAGNITVERQVDEQPIETVEAVVPPPIPKDRSQKNGHRYKPAPITEE